ncbi:MAG: GNAT family N-acetyltransferase [Armatimonadetes bacterium]|nr:GNAT family N-acetyltransferase [Armatimonadota bacterium]
MDELHRAFSANTLATYLGLVEPVNGTVVTKPMGFTLVRGPGPFSFCNFAAGFDVAEADCDAVLHLLSQNCSDCPGLHVFVMSGDRPPDLPARLEAAGFELKLRLASMSWPPQEVAKDAALAEVVEPEERRHVAEFMASQFFWRLPDEAREAISAATAASRHSLQSVGPPEDPVASVMLVPQPGTLGLYNLCVKPELRGQGVGRSVVRTIQHGATLSGRTVVLQCDKLLAPWYAQLGFEEAGDLFAFSFSLGSK